MDPLIGALHDEKYGVRSGAAKTLGEIRDARAVEPLIGALHDENDDVRLWAAEALGKIRDARAVEPLVPLMLDRSPYTRNSAARALRDIGGGRATDALVSACKAGNVQVAAAVYDFFVGRGEAGTEATLVNALSKYGNTQMAVLFLNCGNHELERAAQTWASKHGYRIVPGGKAGAHWRSGTSRQEK